MNGLFGITNGGNVWMRDYEANAEQCWVNQTTNHAGYTTYGVKSSLLTVNVCRPLWSVMFNSTLSTAMSDTSFFTQNGIRLMQTHQQQQRI